MPEHCVSRTIVKSPPELWAELSDPAALTRHLGELGTITITRLEPEREVAWEGERISGTVALEPAGWGTRVTLEAEASRPGVTAEEQPAPPDPVDEVEPGRAEATAAEVADHAAAPIGAAPPDEPEATAGDLDDEEAPTAEPARRGLFARLTGWWRRPPADDEPPGDEAVDEATEGDEPDDELESHEPPLAAAPEDAAPEPRPGDPATWAAAHAVQEAQRVDAVLAAALEALGTPRHRPFSRG
jgi:hypothetical protein